MKYGIPILLVVAMLGACTHAPLKAFPDNSTQFDRTQVSSDIAAMDSLRDIVLTVANPISPPAPHAASNLLGYATSGDYRSGQRAMSTLAELKKHYGLREIVGWPIKPLGLYCAVLRPAPGMDRDALLRALARDDRVRLAEPLRNYAVHAQQPGDMHYNDPYVRLQRGFTEIDAALAQRISQGKGVGIALVDTGVDVTHPDLIGRIGDVHNMVGNNATAFNNDRHGTQVAGVIAADGGNRLGIVGVAPKATLSVYKACWYPADTSIDARCNTFTLAKALSALIGTNIRIINLSLGGPADPLLEQLLTVLLSEDRIVVAAMPPDGRIEGFPAATPGVIVVRSAQASEAPAGVLNAPGKDILTTQPNGRYDFASGSSLAAAHVSGIAALLLSLSPDLDVHAVQGILRRSSTTSDGNHQVNAASAIAALTGTRKTNMVERNSP